MKIMNPLFERSEGMQICVNNVWPKRLTLKVWIHWSIGELSRGPIGPWMPELLINPTRLWEFKMFFNVDLCHCQFFLNS